MTKKNIIMFVISFFLLSSLWTVLPALSASVVAQVAPGLVTPIDPSQQNYGPLPISPQEYKNFEKDRTSFLDYLAKYFPYLTLSLSTAILVKALADKLKQQKNGKYKGGGTNGMQQIDWEAKVKYE